MTFSLDIDRRVLYYTFIHIQRGNLEKPVFIVGMHSCHDLLTIVINQNTISMNSRASLVASDSNQSCCILIS